MLDPFVPRSVLAGWFGHLGLLAGPHALLCNCLAALVLDPFVPRSVLAG